MEEVLEVDEHEVLEKIEDHEKKLGEHKQILDSHNGKIQNLETNTSVLKEKMTNLEGIVTRFESNSYQTQNSMMQLLSQVIVNTSNTSVEIVKNATQSDIEISKNKTEIEKVKNNNTVVITVKILTVISAIILGFLSAKYGITLK